MFDLKKYLISEGVEFIEHGVNVKSGDLEINCPFCREEGSPDPSFHLGINKTTHNYACWRNPDHKGKSLIKLVALISNTTYQKAKELLGLTNKVLFDGDGFNEIVNNIDNLFAAPVQIKKKQKELNFPNTFRSLLEGAPSQKYLDYLISRNFDEATLEELVQTYNLQYSISGRYANKIIFPIYYKEKLVAWTGRSIFKRPKIRYDTLSTDLGATKNVRDLIYNYDGLMHTTGQLLFVTEGPFDMLKLDFLARKMNCRATCLFSKYLSAKRLALLNRISKNFKSIVYLLDKGETATAMRFQAQSSFIDSNVIFKDVPQGFNDPGELQPYGVRQLVSSIVN